MEVAGPERRDRHLRAFCIEREEIHAPFGYQSEPIDRGPTGLDDLPRGVGDDPRHRRGRLSGRDRRSRLAWKYC